MSDVEKDRNYKDQEVEIQTEIDEEALDVVFRLYDKTFKELVER